MVNLIINRHIKTDKTDKLMLYIYVSDTIPYQPSSFIPSTLKNIWTTKEILLFYFSFLKVRAQGSLYHLWGSNLYITYEEGD